MPASKTKQIKIEGLPHVVHVTKRRSSRNIRLRIVKNQVHVSTPSYVSLAAAKQFVQQHRDWILERVEKSRTLADYDRAKLFDGTLITLQAGTSRNSASRKPGQISIKLTGSSSATQLQYVEKTIITYLKAVCRQKVEPHVDELSQRHEVYPELIKYKQVRSRWGSCTNMSVLAFSVYLAQLPDELIRYVVAHELAHIRHLDHSRQFWQFVGEMDPQYASHRKRLKAYDMEITLK